MSFGIGSGILVSIGLLAWRNPYASRIEYYLWSAAGLLYLISDVEKVDRDLMPGKLAVVVVIIGLVVLVVRKRGGDLLNLVLGEPPGAEDGKSTG